MSVTLIQSLANAVAMLPPDLRRANTEPDDPATTDEKIFRSTLFKNIETSSGGRVAFEAFCESLTIASAKNDIDATRFLRRIDQHRRKQKNSCAPSAMHQTDRSPIEVSKRKFERFSVYAQLLGGLIYLLNLQAAKKQVEASYGPFELRSAMIPYYLDLKPACEAISNYQRRERRRRPKGSYDVGYKKPPIAARFSTESNPAKLRKATSAWDALDRSFAKPVSVTRSNGTKTSSTRRQAAYDQLVRSAIKGDRAARAEVVQRILDLSRKGMLAAPQGLRRARRKPMSEEHRQLFAKAVSLGAERLRKEMIVQFEKNLSFNPGIVDYEHEALEAKARSEKTQARRRKDGATPDKAKRKPANVVARGKSANLEDGRFETAREAPTSSRQSHPGKEKIGARSPARSTVERDSSTVVIPTRTRADSGPTSSTSPAQAKQSRAEVPAAGEPACLKPRSRTARGGKAPK